MIDYGLIDLLDTMCHRLIYESELVDGYRGYRLLQAKVVLPVGVEFPRIIVQMYMRDSPCAPDDMMAVFQPVRIEEWGKDGVAEIEALCANAVESIKSLIDRAYADPANLPRLFKEFA